MEELLWKKKSDKELTPSFFAKMMDLLINSRPDINEFDFKIVYSETGNGLNLKENYYGFTRYAWKNFRFNITSELEKYCKKHIVEVYFRNAK